MSEKYGLYLEWSWDVEAATVCLVQIANGAGWQQWEQHRTDTRGIVTERAARAIRAESERLRERLEDVDRVVMAALHDRSKHDVDILLGYLMGLHSHVEAALAGHTEGAGE